VKDPATRQILFINAAHMLTHYSLLILATAVLAMVPQAGDVFGQDYGPILALGTGMFVLYGLGSLPMGWLADRVGRRALMLAFFFGTGVFMALAGLVSSPWALGVVLALMGAFAAIYHPIGTAMLVEAAGDKVGSAVGVNGVFGNLGLAFAAVVTGAVTEAVGWRAAFILPGIMSVAAGLGFAALVRGDGSQGRAAKAMPQLDVSRAVQVKVFAMVALASVLGGMLFYAGTVALPKIFEDRAAGVVSGITEVGGLVSIVFAVAALAQLPVGWLLDRYPVRWIQVSLAAAQLVLLLFAVGATDWLMIGVAMPLLFAIFGEIPIGDWLVARYTADRWRSRAYAVSYVFSMGVSVAIAPLIAALYGASGDFTSLFLVLAACAAGMCVAALVLLPATRPPAVPAVAPAE